MKRALADTLTDLVEGICHPAGAEAPLKVTSLRLDVPLEVTLALLDGDWQFYADLPSWRWQTGSEALRARLRIRWESEVPT